MFRSLVLLFLFSAAVIEPAFALPQFPFVGRVKSDRVYVRAGQNVNFETIAIVNKGDSLVVLSKSYGWLKVKAPAQTKGYLFAEHVTMLTPDIGEIKADKVNIRFAANTSAAIIGKLERGNRFYVQAKEKDWLLIKPVDQMSGWVKEEFVEPVKGAKVPDRLNPDPQIAVPTASKPPVPFLLKKLESGRVEARGILKKDQLGYQVVKDNAVVCVVVGPAEALDYFVDDSVQVLGTIDNSTTDTNPPRVKLEKISFLLP